MKNILFSGIAALVLTAALPTIKPTNAEQMNKFSVYIINDSSSVITSIYARNMETDQSQGDILPGTVGIGEQKLVKINDGTNSCLWRLKAEMADGSTTPWQQHNICDLRSWRIHD